MQQPATRSHRASFGPFTIDLRTNELRKGAARLRVPDQSILVLKALLERPGDLVTREELRQRLWPDDTFVDFEQGLNGIVRRLRDALGDSADTPTYIETLPRRGYRFIGAIEYPTMPNAESAPQNASAGSGLQPRRLLIPSITLFVIVIGAWIVHSRIRSSGTSPIPPRSIPVTSLPGREIDPAVSPDGKYVAYAWDEDRGRDFDIYVKLIDGGEPVPLTTTPARQRWPAWSPDGKRIAFLRRTAAGAWIAIVVPAFGGPERPISETETVLEQRGIDYGATGISWTPDGRWLAFSRRAPGSGDAAVFLCSVDSGRLQQLTAPPAGFRDMSPVISADGRYLAFVRRNIASDDGYVAVQPLQQLRAAGEARRITADVTVIGISWAPDSSSVVYDTDRGIWRVPVAGGSPVPLLLNTDAVHPSVAPDGTVIYQQWRIDTNIWRLPAPANFAHTKPVRIIASTLRDFSPQFSPDGGHIVFVSSRSGKAALWVSPADGSHPLQITDGSAFAGSPRWSPDGSRIAFDSDISANWTIHVVGSHGGSVRAVTFDRSNDVRPSWSRDGKWIYFGSDRSGSWQIWKIAADGGAPVKITSGGGLEAFEGSDRFLYYTKSDGPGVWRVPVSGGEEALVFSRGQQGFFAVAETGVFVMDPTATPSATIEFLDTRSDKVRLLTRLEPGLRFPRQQPSFAVSPDGKWMLYDVFDTIGSDLVALENSR